MLKIAWSPVYNHPLPANHRFPMIKYDLIREQLLYEGVFELNDFFEPKPIDSSIIHLTHDPDYLSHLKNLTLDAKEARRIGFPLSKQLIAREIQIAGGTIECAIHALKYGAALNIAGGTHHAYTNRGEGFCLLNDQAIAANYLIAKGLVQKVLVLDLDVHQGNGTAEIFQENDQVYTISVHGAKNYPFKKELSDWDLPLQDGVEDQEYLALLQIIIDKIPTVFSPDFIFYQSGVDGLLQDRLGRLNLSLEGLKTRDEMVFQFAKQRKIPIVVCMGGGYAEKVSDVVDAHVNTFKVARDSYE